MENKVAFALTEAVVRDLTKGFTGWDTTSTYQVELCQFRTSEGKGKDFCRLTPVSGSPVIVKVFPEADGSMGMTGDREKRELMFVQSELHQRFAEFIAMPEMAVYQSPEGVGVLAMEDVSEALTKIGPGAVLTPELVRDLIKAFGRMHNCYWQKVPGWSWLMDFEVWVRRGMELLLLASGESTKPAWAQAILSDKPGLERGMTPFVASLTSGEREKFFHVLRHPELILRKIADTPRTVGHNDTFFTNLGLQDGRILLIDWEFVGVSPAPWDIHCSYAGMPPVGVSEEEMLELYFAEIPAATAEERKLWLEGYRVMGLVEALIYGMRVLVPALYDPESKVPEHVREFMRGDLASVMEEVARL